MNILLELLKYIVPALVVLAACYLIVQKFLVAETQRKQLALFKDTQDVTLKMRLGAYERLVLFIERISPRQLLSRVYDPSLNVAELQEVMIVSIKAEFEHNMSQQIYISQSSWETLKGVKEQEMNMINRIASNLNPEAPAKELYTRIIEYVLTVDGQLPTEVALKVLGDEAKRAMHNGSF